MEGRVVVLFLLFCLLAVEIRGISFEVKARKEECLSLKTKKETNVKFRYQVIEGGNMDIDLTIHEPEGTTLYEEKKKNEGKLSFKTNQEGMYRFCFSNSFSSVTSKTISVYLQKAGGVVAKQEHISPIEDEILKLENEIMGLKDDVQFIYLQELTHRSTTEDTFERVTYATIFEGIALVIVNIWQIITLRRFFEVKRHL